MAVPPNPPSTNHFEPPLPGGSSSDSPVAQPIVIEDSGGALSRLVGWTLAWTGWIGVLLALVVIFYLWSGRNEYFDTTNGITENFVDGNENAQDKVAIIDIAGVIYDGEGFIKHQINRIIKDEDVKAVVIRVDSPGGTVAGSDYILHHLKELRSDRKLPMVVSMGSVAASGGYYVSMAVGDQVKSIFAEPTTTTGSIGVIIPHYDVSGLLENFHVKDDSIVSHPRKQMLTMTKPIPDDERKILQDHVNDFFELFKQRVKEGRPIFRKDEEALNQLATGELFTAPKAKQFGLVDEIGFLEDAIKRATELAGLDDKFVRVVRYKRPSGLLDVPLFAQSQSPNLDVRTLFELSTPRAYFLATSLPPLVRSQQAN